jgi:hypothetical protein
MEVSIGSKPDLGQRGRKCGVEVRRKMKEEVNEKI